MPNYRTHSIHGDNIYDYIDKYVDIDQRLLRIFCIGPDSLIPTDYITFERIHSSNTKQYFLKLLKLIKENKLYENSVVMSFLYGQLAHFSLDLSMHPLIYYMSEDMPSNNLLSAHALIEHWIDDYVIHKYGSKNELYYQNISLVDNDLQFVLDYICIDIYHAYDGFNKYNLGVSLILLYDNLIRKNGALLKTFLDLIINLGDIKYHDNYEKVKSFLNLENEIWYHPITGKVQCDSFDDLWNKSLEILYDLIMDANNYLYNDKEFKNNYIINNYSYNTGLPCEEGENFQYIKRYK